MVRRDIGGSSQEMNATRLPNGRRALVFGPSSQKAAAKIVIVERVSQITHRCKTDASVLFFTPVVVPGFSVGPRHPSGGPMTNLTALNMAPFRCGRGGPRASRTATDVS